MGFYVKLIGQFDVRFDLFEFKREEIHKMCHNPCLNSHLPAEYLREFWDEAAGKIKDAAKIRLLAISNSSGLKTGTGVFARNPKTQEKKWFFCHNLKSTSGSLQVCSEKGAFLMATATGFTEIIGIIVVAPPRAGDGTEVIHSCEACRTDFRNAPGFYANTALLFVHAEDHSRQERHGMKDFLAMYEAIDRVWLALRRRWRTVEDFVRDTQTAALKSLPWRVLSALRNL